MLAPISFLVLHLTRPLAGSPFYPELRSDLQSYQDVSRVREYKGYLKPNMDVYGLTTRNAWDNVKISLGIMQRVKKCYPDIGEWILMYRNYYMDQDLGGAEKCVKYERSGEYEDFSTPAGFTFGQHGSLTGTIMLSSSPCYQSMNNHTFVPNNDDGVVEVFHAIFIDCESCFVGRHPYAADGYGCSLWRRSDSLHLPAEACDFIYDENCGSSPKYEMYTTACEW